MRGIIRLSLLILLVAPAGPARAQKTYTLDDCYQASQKRNETLLTQQEVVVQAEERYRQAIGNVLPSLTGTAAYSRQDNSRAPGGLAGAFFPAEQRLAKVTATQPLFRGFREYAALRLTGNQIATQKDNWRWAAVQLYTDVAQAFYNILTLQTDLAHIDRELQLYVERVQDLRDRVRIGRSRAADVLTMQTAQALLAAQREQAAGQLRVAREVLAFLTGLVPDIALADSEAVPSAVEPVDHYLAAVENRPDVRAARETVAAAREGVRIAAGAHWPSLDASANYYLERTGPEQDISWDAQIALTLPIFSGGIIVAQTRLAESQLRQSELALSLALRQETEDIVTLHFRLTSDAAQVAALENALALAERSYRAVVRDYDLGLVTTLDVLQALVSYQDALRSLDRARFAAKLDNLRLEAAAGRRPRLPAGESRP